ncbi:BTAD domain-containing putative transcriptional regulator, partial [Pseudolysinimonas sp.]|uniref:AfsR/SARP family transcriptional regulator n=1 Tax=Pseudolysinimonas sp. TaxID=2680009 RepID=UPI00286C5472
MHISVLGPLTVDAGHIRPRDRVILAALTVRRGAIVSADELAEACWGDDQPGTWWQQVKTAVARIRAVLGQDSIRTEGQGYAFGLDAGVLDAEQFERMVAAGREHAIRGDHDRAADALRRSLTLWRGAAFPEVADWPPARIEASRLAEIKTSAEEELLDARLERGESASVIAEAQRLVREEPLRESRWAILALANYRGQRQGEALAVLREARTRLADTLGIEPGERLTRLESAILRQDPAITRATIAAPGSDQCPYLGLRTFDAESADRFFGREDEIATLLSRARRGEVLAVVGPSGSGKSSLLLAGVVPALRDTGSTTEQLVLQSGVAAHAERLAAG